MTTLATLAALFVALSHAGFLVLEMFLWEQPIGRRIFRNSEEFAAATKVLAANQGLYNGFLSAGVLWGTFRSDGGATLTFFLVCVIIAGLYGALTVSRRILLFQALPAAIALALALAYGTA